jgi:peptidoglycan lytic transglycosylase B
MKWFGFLLLMMTVIFCLLVPAARAEEPRKEFAAWLQGLRVEARAAGISQRTLDEALRDVAAPRPRVIESDRNQPEQTETLEDYVAARVSQSRIKEGRRMLRRYPTWLGRVERRYGVQRRYIVALWGIETRYGKYPGGLPVIPSLVTLAYDQRRGDYFRRELLEALRILDAGHIPLARMRGSWAGAMGQCQFMPSAFRRFAVDADGDGRVDIWNSVPDVLASIANYLAHTGWQDDQIWGRPVRLPKRFDLTHAGLATRHPLSLWQSLGVRRRNGRHLPRRHLKASLLLAEDSSGPAYLVYDNFRSLLAWNHANAFAVAVGTLAERIGKSR